MLINSNFTWEKKLEITIIFNDLIEFVQTQKLLDRDRPYDTPFDDKLYEWCEKKYIGQRLLYRCETLIAFDRVIMYLRFEDATKELEQELKEYINPTL